MRLVVGRGAVVARFGHFNAIRNDGVAQLLHPIHDGVGHVDGVFARLLGDQQGDCGVFTATVGLGLAVPHIAAGGQGAIADFGHVFQEERFAATHPHHQLGNVAGLHEKRACLYGHRLVAADEFTHGHAHVGGLQRAAQILHGGAGAGHARRVQAHHDGPARAAHRLHFARAGHPLDFSFHAVGHALQRKSAGVCVLAEECEGDDGNIVNALGFDDGLQHPQIAR